MITIDKYLTELDSTVESWAGMGMLQDIEDLHHRRICAAAMENVRVLNTTYPDGGSMKIRVFRATSVPLVRRIVANWQMHRLVSVQPAMSPRGTLWLRRLDGGVQDEAYLCRARKLASNYPTVEGDFDPKNDQQLQQLSELTDLVARDVIADIQHEAVVDILSNAGHYVYCKTDQAGTMIAEFSEKIAERSGSGPADWVIGSAEMAGVLGATDFRDLYCGWKEGKFGALAYFIDPQMKSEQVLVGRKGSEWYDGGLFYLPYIMVGLGDSDDDRLIVRYCKKMLTGRAGVYPKGSAYYGKLVLTDIWEREAEAIKNRPAVPGIRTDKVGANALEATCGEVVDDGRAMT